MKGGVLLAINWRKGFNRLWLFFSITLGILVFVVTAAYDEGFGRAPLVAILCFGIPFVVGHIVFRVVLWIIKGFRGP